MRAKITRYEQVSRRIRHLIENGALKEGDRLPSLRQMSEEMQVSINTVKEAYWRLENQCHITAVPQSGYYVRKQPQLSPVDRKADGSSDRRPTSAIQRTPRHNPREVHDVGHDQQPDQSPLPSGQHWRLAPISARSAAPATPSIIPPQEAPALRRPPPAAGRTPDRAPASGAGSEASN